MLKSREIVNLQLTPLHGIGILCFLCYVDIPVHCNLISGGVEGCTTARANYPTISPQLFSHNYLTAINILVHKPVGNPFAMYLYSIINEEYYNLLLIVFLQYLIVTGGELKRDPLQIVGRKACSILRCFTHFSSHRHDYHVQDSANEYNLNILNVALS